MTSGEGTDPVPLVIPRDGRYEAIADRGAASGGSCTGPALAQGLRTWQREAEGRGEVVIRNLRVVGWVDLSFDRFAARVIFDGCSFEKGLVARAADLAGLEVYGGRIDFVDLSHARMRGDLRLVDLSARTAVVSTGTVVAGTVELAGSGSALTEEDEDNLLAAQRRGRAEAATPNVGVNGELVLQSVGLVTALTAWVAVIGGATLWAQLESINAPALPTLAAVGQVWMVTQGLQTLLVPLLLATAVSALVYFSRWEGRPSDVHDPADGAAERARNDHAPTYSWRRLRPIRVLRRLPLEDPSLVPLLLVVVTALISSWLFIAQASWEVLVATLLIVALAVAHAKTGRGTDSITDDEGNWPGPAFTVSVVAVPLVAGLAVGGVFALGAASCKVSSFAAVGGLIASGVLQVAFRASEPGSAWPVRLVALAGVGGVLLSLAATVEGRWVVITGVVTALIAWVTLGALAGRSARAAAVAMFVAIVVWSGAVQYARVIGDRTPDLPIAVAYLQDGGQVGGFMVGRTDDYVFLAQNDRDDELAKDPRRHVVALPGDQVQRVVYGESMVLPDDEVKEWAVAEEAGEQEAPWWSFLTPDDGATKIVLGDHLAGCTDDCPDLTGTQGSAPDQQPHPLDPDDPVVDPGQEGHSPEPRPAFEDQPARESRDEVLLGVPARLELIGLTRSGPMVYLDVRVANLGTEAASAADLLGLVGRRFNTPRLIDPPSQDVFEVTRTGWHCDCSRALDRTLVAPSQAVRAQAMFVVRRHLTRLDVTVPGFGVFRGVPVE